MNNFTFRLDKLFINGKIHTFRFEGDIVEAMAVHGDKIVAVGDTDAFRKVSVKEVIDLNGRTVIPGLIDSHLHLYEDYLSRKEINLGDVHSYDALCSVLHKAAQKIRQGEWIVGMNLHMERLQEKRFPTKEVLDRVSKDIPIVVKSFCGHANIINSKALELAGIDKGSEQEIPGTVEYDKDGIPNGIVREETFLYKVNSIIPPPSFEQAVEEAGNYLQDCASYGLTTLHTNDISDTYKLELFQAIKKGENLCCRIIYYPTNISKTGTGAITGFGDQYIKLGAMKMFMDGSVGAATAAMKEPYTDQDTMGLLIQNQEETNRKVKEAYDAGMDVAVHAIGDRGINMVLTAFENAYDKSIGWNRRFYLIHGYLADQEAIERMKKLPIVIPTQPVFIRNFTGMARQRLGEERTNRLFPNRTFIDNGILIGGSSDAPIQECNPFYGIQCAVTRKSMDGSEEIIAPEQAVTVYEALDMYTRQAAFVGQEENMKGTLEAGKLADFIVLEKDIFTMDKNDIYKMKVMATYLGGTKVYSYE